MAQRWFHAGPVSQTGVHVKPTVSQRPVLAETAHAGRGYVINVKMDCVLDLYTLDPLLKVKQSATFIVYICRELERGHNVIVASKQVFYVLKMVQGIGIFIVVNRHYIDKLY